jgi:hypothetical protein
VEPLKEAVPRLFRVYEERKDALLLKVLVLAVERQHTNIRMPVTVSVSDLWEQMVPQMPLMDAKAL